MKQSNRMSDLRADLVGVLLITNKVKQNGLRQEKGEISAEELRATEDAVIAKT